MPNVWRWQSRDHWTKRYIQSFWLKDLHVWKCQTKILIIKMVDRYCNVDSSYLHWVGWSHFSRCFHALEQWQWNTPGREAGCPGLLPQTGWSGGVSVRRVRPPASGTDWQTWAGHCCWEQRRWWTVWDQPDFLPARCRLLLGEKKKTQEVRIY